MPRAEMGSTKQIANQMKSKGLQRLRWYCQVCAKQCRDENGFKCHVASESHVRNMSIVGEDPRKVINEYSNQFQSDFVKLLRTGHGEKKVNVNRFYNEYIANKEHVHMNATKWPSLTEFAKFLGREGICRVEEDEKDDGRGGAGGLTIRWIDNSPEALRRQDALKKRERQDKGDEEREQKMIRAQIRRARLDLGEDGEGKDEEAAEGDGFKRRDGEKVVLSFGVKKDAELAKPLTPPSSDKDRSPEKDTSPSEVVDEQTVVALATASALTQAIPAVKPISFIAKPKNVFAAAPRKNALGGAKKTAGISRQKPMSEAERIMKEEIERRRRREMNGPPRDFKKQRVS
jgi:DNA/RNA-binding protein KIN17